MNRLPVRQALLACVIFILLLVGSMSQKTGNPVGVAGASPEPAPEEVEPADPKDDALRKTLEEQTGLLREISMELDSVNKNLDEINQHLKEPPTR